MARKAFERADRRKRVEELYLGGESQHKIAAALQVSQATVSRDLEYWFQIWKTEAIDDIWEQKLTELRRMDRLEAAAWRAWERSCQDEETRHVEQSAGITKLVKRAITKTLADGSTERQEVYESIPIPDQQKTWKTIRGQAGDPRFLERVGWCIQKRLEIMGALRTESPASTTVVTVVQGIDLAVVTGQKPGLTHERISQPSQN